jgi:hypothetical protein
MLLLHHRTAQQPVAELNRFPRLERPESGPIDERASSVGREALESSSAVLQTAARPSQLPAQTKKAGHRVTPGLEEGTRMREYGVTSARETPVAMPVRRRCGFRVSVRVSKLIPRSSSPPQLSSLARFAGASPSHSIRWTKARCKRFAFIPRIFRSRTSSRLTQGMQRR